MPIEVPILLLTALSTLCSKLPNHLSFSSHNKPSIPATSGLHFEAPSMFFFSCFTHPFRGNDLGLRTVQVTALAGHLLRKPMLHLPLSYNRWPFSSNTILLHHVHSCQQPTTNTDDRSTSFLTPICVSILIRAALKYPKRVMMLSLAWLSVGNW